MPHHTASADLDYIRKTYARQDALLAEIDAALSALGIGMQLNAIEGRLLQLLIKMHGVKTVVEIGTLAGGSAIWMARALPEDGHVYTIDNDPRHIAMAREFFDRSEVRPRITQIEGDARDVLATLAARGPYDMIFIDADKGGYNVYLDWAEKNIRKGGLVVADNTLLFGTIALPTPPKNTSPATWEAMQRFNQRLADPKKYFSTMIPTSEGLTVAIKIF